MKYVLAPTNAGEEQAMKSGAFPLPMLDTLLPLVQMRSIVAGVHLGLFPAIGQELRSVNDLARELSVDSECLELLLHVLACAGYVHCEGGRYGLTEVSRGSLLPESPLKLSTFVEWNHFTWRWLEKLEEVVRTGAGVDAHEDIGPAPNWAIYQRAMLELAQTVAGQVAALVPIRSGARKLLDIGGAHGFYGAMICRRHPALRSEVLDLPEAVEHARELAHEVGIDDVVTHKAGDALHGDLGEGYDAVFIGYVVHHFTDAQSRDLFRRIGEALVPGGTVAIWDYKRPESDAGPELGGDALALFFRITSTAQCYRSSDYIEWLKSAGFENVAAQVAPFAPSSVLVTGTRPGH